MHNALSLEMILLNSRKKLRSNLLLMIRVVWIEEFYLFLLVKISTPITIKLTPGIKINNANITDAIWLLFVSIALRYE